MIFHTSKNSENIVSASIFPCDKKEIVAASIFYLFVCPPCWRVTVSELFFSPPCRRVTISELFFSPCQRVTILELFFSPPSGVSLFVNYFLPIFELFFTYFLGGRVYLFFTYLLHIFLYFAT